MDGREGNGGPEGGGRFRIWRAARTAGIALAAVLALSGPAFGYGQTWLGASLEKIVTAARGRFGPARYNFALKLENAGYDSDVYFGMRSSAVPDYTFAVSPDLGLFVPLTKQLVFAVFEAPRYVFYLENERDRALNNVFQTQVHISLGSLYVQAWAALTNAKERVSTELTLNIRRKENELKGLAFWQFGQGTALAIRYRHVSMEYAGSDREVFDIQSSLNRLEDHLSATAYLAQISRSRILIEADTALYRPRDSLSGFRRSEGYGFYGGIEFIPETDDQAASKRLQGRIHLGYRRFRVPNSDFKDLNALVANTSVSARLSKRTAVRGDITRNVQFSAFARLGYYLQTNAGAGLAQTLGRSAELSYLFSAVRNDYAEIGEAAAPPRRDTILIHIVRLNLRLAERLSLDLSLNLSRRSSNLAGPASNKQSLGLSLVFGSVAGLNILAQSPFAQ